MVKFFQGNFLPSDSSKFYLSNGQLCRSIEWKIAEIHVFYCQTCEKTAFFHENFECLSSKKHVYRLFSTPSTKIVNHEKDKILTDLMVQDFFQNKLFFLENNRKQKIFRQIFEL